MNRLRATRIALLAVAAGALLALPAGAEAKKAGAAATGVDLTLGKKGKVDLLKKVVVDGTVATPLPGDRVEVTVSASGRTLFKKTIDPKAGGRFEVPITVNACCVYRVLAEAGGKSDKVEFGVNVPKGIGKGPATKLFNQLLQKEGFHTGTKGPRATIGTRLAIKAFRKTNNMARSEAYRPSIFRSLLMGKGGFDPKYDDGRHVEVDISRQVMSLIEGDTPVHTFHVSTGTSATPTIRGKFNFYMKQAGYNAKRMYFSVYFRGGYATHGYNPVPNYNASHGCVRNPIPFSRFIYNWVQIGMPIYVYG
jgi:hypothetical protein